MNLYKSFKNFITRKSYTGLLFSSDGSSAYKAKTARDYLDINDISLYVNRAIDKRADKVSEVRFVLRKGKDEIEDPFNPWLLLLSRPNKYFTGKQFWKLLQKYIDITGEAYIYLESERELFQPEKVKAMHLLQPDRVKINFNKEGTDIVNYEYTTDTKTFIYLPEQVIRVFEPDPLCPLRGVSLLRSGLRQIDTDNQLTELQMRVIRNGGHIGGVFRFKDKLTSDQLKQLEEKYAEKYSEAKNSGKPLFLGGDAEWLKTALSPIELGFIESKKLTLDDIATLTGVPRALLARPSDETFSNADAAQNIFLRDTIKPLIQQLVTILDWRLIPDEFDLDFVDPTPENREEIRKDLQTASQVYAISTNEKREILGLEPIPDGDEILVPFSVTPLGKSLTQDTTEEKKVKTVEFQHPLKDPIKRKVWGEIQYKRLDRRQARLRKVLRDYFEEQKKRIVSQIEGRRSFKVKALVDQVFDSKLEISLASRTVLPLLRQMMIDAGQDTFEILDVGVQFTMTSQLESWLDKRVDTFSHTINETTFNKLKSEFEESFDKNETRQQLIKRIENVYDEYTESRAATIARTEVHGAVQTATEEAYKEAGIPIKIWVWSPGVMGGVREEHIKMDGEEQSIGQPFSNGLQYPGDPSGDPEETINCECTI